MPLTWNAAETEAYKSLGGDEDSYRSLIQAICFSLLPVGFPPGDWKITEKNWEEVYKRLAIYERIAGAMRIDSDHKPIYTTRDEVKSLIGFTCNAGTKTKAEFKKNMWDILERNVP